MTIAHTPKPPYYAAIFTSLRTEGDHGYAAMAQRMEELASQQPGFLGIESARDGLGITVSYWESEEAIRAWHSNAEHQLAQQRGYSDWYASFHLRVARVERAYSFTRPPFSAHRLVDLLSSRLPGYFVGLEILCRVATSPQPTTIPFGAVSRLQWDSRPAGGLLPGLPELVIEVLSPSNTVSEMLEKEEMCLSSGAREFWLVDPIRRAVRISSTSEPNRAYSSGAAIPLPSGDTLPVDLIFSSSHP